MLQKPIPVLMYHRIDRPDPKSSLVISPETFSKQLQWLVRKKFRFLSLDEVMDRQRATSLWAKEVALTFDDGFKDNDRNAFSLLLREGLPAALFVVVNWVGTEGFLDWKVIGELASSGITIGSHSLTHRWLPDIEDPEELRREIAESKRIIEDRIGRRVNHFSYPVGGTNKRVIEEVKRAGYETGWVAGARVDLGAEGDLCDERYVLRRVKIGTRDKFLLRFAVKAYGITGLARRERLCINI